MPYLMCDVKLMNQNVVVVVALDVDAVDPFKLDG